MILVLIAEARRKKKAHEALRRSACCRVATEQTAGVASEMRYTSSPLIKPGHGAETIICVYCACVCVCVSLCSLQVMSLCTNIDTKVKQKVKDGEGRSFSVI